MSFQTVGSKSSVEEVNFFPYCVKIKQAGFPLDLDLPPFFLLLPLPSLSAQLNNH